MDIGGFKSMGLLDAYDDSIRKVVFLSVKEISKKWKLPVRNWVMAYSQIMIFFEDRFAA
ncbi:MAG: hypothetical protein M0P14_08785 [Alkaliphilus sp.]|nr:hypothetical protein [Alkaliphilus sp.]